jgi:hypothetical protein
MTAPKVIDTLKLPSEFFASPETAVATCDSLTFHALMMRYGGVVKINGEDLLMTYEQSDSGRYTTYALARKHEMSAKREMLRESAKRANVQHMRQIADQVCEALITVCNVTADKADDIFLAIAEGKIIHVKLEI